MTRSSLRRIRLSAAVALFAATPQLASAQVWTSWNSANAGNVFGTIGATSVVFTGTYDSYENSTTGFNYWQPNGAYTQNSLIGPTNAGLIRFRGNGGSGTIFFSNAVLNPYIAFNSVGQPGVPVTYDFGTSAFTVLSNNNAGGAFWGPGSFSTSGNVLTGNEFSGVAQFSGVYNSISFRASGEDWHGFTVGVGSNVVPEPSTYVLMAAGLAGLAVAARRRRR